MGMVMTMDVFAPLTLSTALLRRKPARKPEAGPWAPSDPEMEMLLMTALNEMKRDVPPPSPEKMAAGKRRLLELAAERRRERLMDLAG
jgi:hypothetical protein